ncbi:MAG: recombinase family protein [bacterium]
MVYAFIYTRVSSERQVTEGNGTQSQEQRCRSYAKFQGYQVKLVVPDDGVSGAILNRPGMRKLLEELRTFSGEKVVIIDDISRLARDIKTHIELRAAIATCGATLESPNMKFEETAVGEYIEMIMAATAQFQRKGNREQVINRQRARLEMGYWTFHAPLGLHYEKHPLHKKLITPDQTAYKLAEGLERYAIGSISTKRALATHLIKNGFFVDAPLDIIEKKLTRVFDNLSLYAGYIEYPAWNIEKVKGRHTAIIGDDIYNLLLGREGNLPERLGNRTQPNSEFILRNFVRCPHCMYGFTASYAKPGKKFPRYYCRNQKCAYYGRTVRRDILTDKFEELLKSLEAKDGLIQLLERLSKEEWTKKLESWERTGKLSEQRVEEYSRELARATKRLLKTTNEHVAEEIEIEIDKLRAQQKGLEIDVSKYRQSPPNFEEALGRVSTLLKSPYSYWKSGSDEQKRTVHNIVFTVPPSYDITKGVYTVSYALPYQVLNTLKEDRSRVVDQSLKTWNTFFKYVEEWEPKLEEIYGNLDYSNGF